MAHSLVLGMTESGKTTLAKRLSRAYYQNGWGVLILDPMGDPGWYPYDTHELPFDQQVVIRTQVENEKRFYQTADPDDFLKMFWASRKCMAFIDESGDMVGQYDKAMQQTATKGRHWGHSVHFLSQRGAQLARTVRDQCSHLFLFTTAKKDATLHADEWNQPELVNASLLPQGEYFHVTRFGKLQRGNLFGESSNVGSNNHRNRSGSDGRGAVVEEQESSEVGNPTDDGDTSESTGE